MADGDAYDPSDPNTWTGDQRSAYLGAAGFKWISGNGDRAIWIAPNGEPMDEVAAFTALSHGTVPRPSSTPKPPAPAKAVTYSLPNRNGLMKGSDGNYYRAGPTYNSSDTSEVPNMVQGQPVVVDPSELATMTGGGGGSGSGSGGTTEYQQAQLDQARQKAQMDYDLAVRNGDRQAAQYAQSRLDAIQQHQDTLGYNREQLAQSASESAAQRAFSGEQSALSRAQQAGQFAAQHTLAAQAEQRAQLEAKVQAAKTYADLSGSPDLTGYSRFMSAGGGVLGNAIAGGGDALTSQGQLGAARILRALDDERKAKEAEAAFAAQYQADWYGLPGMSPNNINRPGYGPDAFARPGGQGGPRPGFENGVTGKEGAAWRAQQLANDINRRAASSPGSIMSASPGAPAAPAVDYSDAAMAARIADSRAAGSGSGGDGFAYGTAFDPIRRRPVSEAVAAMPTGASMDTLTGRYAQGALGSMDRLAHGSFITGDSTDPNDPAAGGAHPEQVNLVDPPGPNNAAAEVTPLTEPGVGDTGGGSIGALLIAIGRFLDARGGEESPEPRMALGGRYALGTSVNAIGGPGNINAADAVTPEDQQYIDQVLAQRRATKYSINPYAADFSQQSPTQRAIDAAAFQTATGVPGSEIAFEADKYAPGGLARNSRYAQELQLGL